METPYLACRKHARIKLVCEVVDPYSLGRQEDCTCLDSERALIPLALSFSQIKLWSSGGNAAVAPSSTAVVTTLNPLVADLAPSKTMMLSDLASSLREAGKDIISLAAGEPDFDTPEPIIKAGIQAMQ